MTVKYLFLFPLDLTNFSSGPISQMTPFEEKGTYFCLYLFKKNHRRPEAIKLKRPIYILYYTVSK